MISPSLNSTVFPYTTLFRSRLTLLHFARTQARHLGEYMLNRGIYCALIALMALVLTSCGNTPTRPSYDDTAAMSSEQVEARVRELEIGRASCRERVEMWRGEVAE